MPYLYIAGVLVSIQLAAAGWANYTNIDYPAIACPDWVRYSGGC